MQLTRKEIDHRMMRLSDSGKVREAMSIRCEESGHEYENCMSIMFHVYRGCRWCGHKAECQE